MLHVRRPYAPHPHLPHLHVESGFDEHPWRMLPVLLASLVLLATVLIVLTFAIAKAVTGHAY